MKITQLETCIRKKYYKFTHVPQTSLPLLIPDNEDCIQYLKDMFDNKINLQSNYLINLTEHNLERKLI